MDPPPPGQHRPGHRPPFDVLDVDGPAGERAIGQLAAAMAWRVRGRWSAPVVAGGISIWPRPVWATSTRPAWSMWTGGAGVATWSPHPASHASGLAYRWAAGRDLDVSPGEVPVVLLKRLQPRQLQRPTGPVQLAAADDGSDERYARAALAEELARVAAAPVGQRNRQLWESTRNLYNLVAIGALDQREVQQGLLAASDRCGLLAEAAPDPAAPWPPAASRPRPSSPPTPTHHPRTHSCPAGPARAGGRRAGPGGEVMAMTGAGQPAG